VAELDDIYRQLGTLTAVCTESQRQMVAVFAKQDKLNEEVIEHRGQLKLLASQTSENKHKVANVDQKVDANARQVDEVRNKGKGLIIGMSIIGGGGGLAGFFAGLKNLFP
jgi:predicted RecB family endonuclease